VYALTSIKLKHNYQTASDNSKMLLKSYSLTNFKKICPKKSSLEMTNFTHEWFLVAGLHLPQNSNRFVVMTSQNCCNLKEMRIVIKRLHWKK
jgi:hypothetical protein